MTPDSLHAILVPIDFDDSTEFIIAQAMELSAATGAAIYLLHIQRSTEDAMNDMPQSNEIIYFGATLFGGQAQKKILEWKHSIEETLPAIKVKAYLAAGVVHDNIVEVAARIKPGLIIIGTKKKSRFFKYYRSLSANELTRLTGCPVLTVMNRISSKKIQTIVVPVGNFIPNNKIAWLSVFARMYRARIHLVALHNKISEQDAERNALLETFQLLKICMNNPLEYHLLEGHNFAKATLKYAQDIGADMIFVNPFSETKVSYLMGTHINDMLPPTSKIKILSVQPSVDGRSVIRVGNEEQHHKN